MSEIVKCRVKFGETLFIGQFMAKWPILRIVEIYKFCENVFMMIVKKHRLVDNDKRYPL